MTLIGLGPGDPDALARGAERALLLASEQHSAGTGKLFLRTSRHPTVDVLREWGLRFDTFDALYDSASSFDEVYEAISGRVLDAAAAMPVTFAVPGHPLFAEESVRLILQAVRDRGISAQVIGSASFVDAALAAVGLSLGAGCDLRDALGLPLTDSIDLDGNPAARRVDTSRPLLVYQIYDCASASHAKLALMRDYPDDWGVKLVRWAGVPHREEVLSLPLFQLDRQAADHLTSLYVPPLPPSLRRPGFPDLVGIMARLRAPNGCPWDREQDHSTLRRFFIEETYEVIEAIDSGDMDLLCEELGDVLLQVVFHAQLAAEEGLFNIDDVSARIVEKLVRRHPHVFGTESVADSDEVLRNWERIKRSEKAGADKPWRESILDGVPKGLPALMQAMEMSKRAAKVGFEWESLAGVIAKLYEETGELRDELSAGDPDNARIASELGDLLFTLVQIARWCKIDPEEAMRAMLGRFAFRFRFIEQRAKEQGVALGDMSLAEMDALWDQAKRLGEKRE